MGEFAGLISMLSDEKLASLHGEDMGVLSLHEVTDLLKRIRTELEAGEVLVPDEIPTSVRNEFLSGNFATQLDSLIQGMAQYGESTENPAVQRNQYKNVAEGLRNLVVERLRPIIRTDEAKLHQMLAEVQALASTLSDLRDDLEKQRTALAQSSTKAAASDLSTHYTAQASSHDTTATNFFKASIAAGVLLTGLTAYFFIVSPPDYTSNKTAEQWIEVVTNAVARLLLLSIAGIGLAFCLRNYRVNMHLQVLNKRRENALNTFGLLQAGVTTDEARNIVVGELVRAVFTSEETGYLGNETERTVIESPGSAGMLSAVTAMTKSQGS